MFGVSNTEFAGTPLPLSLSTAGVPGCSLLVAANWIGAHPMTSGRVAVRLETPNEHRLLGMRLFEQVLVHDPTLPGGWTATDGVALTFGAR